MHISRKFLFNFFCGNFASFELRNLSRYTVYICTFAGNSYLLFLWENLNLNGQKYCVYSFVQIVWNQFDVNDKDIFDSEHPNVTQMWQLLIDYVYLIITNIDYDVLSDCPSLIQGIGIHYVQHFQAMLDCGVCELAHSFSFTIYLFFWTFLKTFHHEREFLLTWQFEDSFDWFLQVDLSEPGLDWFETRKCGLPLSVSTSLPAQTQPQWVSRKHHRPR